MASRNRTNLYISYRQSYAHHPTQSYSTYNPSSTEELDTLISNRADAAIEMDILPPAWADKTQEVDEILQNIAKMSAKLDKLHARHVLPGFDDKREEEGEIERLTFEITNQFHECQKHIKEVQRQAKGLVDTEAIMAKNIQISLATKVQESSTQFRKKQSSYLRRLGGNERSSTPSFLDDTSAPDYDVSISQSALKQQQSQHRLTNDAAIMQREREIEDIAKGILELSEIFKELQSMVIDQGTMLDRIDYNVELTRERVKDAHVDLGEVFPHPIHPTPPHDLHLPVQRLMEGCYVPETNAETDDYVTSVSGDIVVIGDIGNETTETVVSSGGRPHADGESGGAG